MNKKHYDSIIKLSTIGKIESQPDKTYNKYFNSKYKNIDKKPINYGILIEKRKHKVITDENKLYGTKPNHKYFK